MLETISFYTFSLLTIISFIIVVTSSQAIYAMSALAAGMIFISGFFFTLGADFLGVVQIIVYAGAVMALYAFGMMFFDSAKAISEVHRRPKLVKWLTVASTLLIILMAMAPITFTNLTPDAILPTDVQNPQGIGIILFTEYLLAFELASLMLLVAMICGIVLAGKQMDDSMTTNIDDGSHAKNFDDFDIPVSKEHV
jgi:NADH-quinone oxidoreductase subunit J